MVTISLIPSLQEPVSSDRFKDFAMGEISKPSGAESHETFISVVHTGVEGTKILKGISVRKTDGSVTIHMNFDIGKSGMINFAFDPHSIDVERWIELLDKFLRWKLGAAANAFGKVDRQLGVLTDGISDKEITLRFVSEQDAGEFTYALAGRRGNGDLEFLLRDDFSVQLFQFSLLNGKDFLAVQRPVTPSQ